MSTAYLSLGSNIDAEKNIRSGISALHEAFETLELSPLYRSEAFGFEGGDFINLAARIETDLEPLALKQFLTDLEDRHDRNRNVPKFSDRTLDIDILLYDDLWLLSPALEFPRDEILEAPHVLKPLADLAPDLVHPALGKTLSILWKDSPFQNASLVEIKL